MKEHSFVKVKTRPFTTKAEVRHPYIFGGIRSVINVSEREDKEIVSPYKSLGISYYHFPTNEECKKMNWSNIKAAAKVLLDNIANDIPTIVHCIGGNNRSHMIVKYAYFALHGMHLADEYRAQPSHLIYNSRFLGQSIKDIECELKQLTK